MNPKLEALKQKFKEKEEKKSEGKSSNFGDYYPFWNMKPDEKSIVRTLPFKGMSDDDLLPFVDKLEHILSINGEDKKIPCRKMYGETCPICDLSAKYYKADGKGSEKGKYYWRDAKSLASIFVVKDPLPPNEETGENDEGKVKVVQLGYQIKNKYEKNLKTLLADGEIEDLPWDLRNGLNFKIVKDEQGGYANYGTSSSFANNSTSLPEDFIENFEPVDLRKYLPADPGLDKVQRMLDAHLTGGDYSEDEANDSSDTKESKPKEESVKESKSEKETKSEKTASKSEAKSTAKVEEEQSEGDEGDDDDDYIAALKRRSKKNA